MSDVHVFTTCAQPATEFVDSNIDPPLVIKSKPRSLVRCYRCGARRYASNALVRVYYDCVQYFCCECPKKKSKKRRRHG